MQNLWNGLSYPYSAERQRRIAGLSILALGVIMILGVGLASPEAIHNAAHDLRHGLGFPCH